MNWTNIGKHLCTGCIGCIKIIETFYLRGTIQENMLLYQCVVEILAQNVKDMLTL